MPLQKLSNPNTNYFAAHNPYPTTHQVIEIYRFSIVWTQRTPNAPILSLLSCKQSTTGKKRENSKELCRPSPFLSCASGSPHSQLQGFNSFQRPISPSKNSAARESSSSPTFRHPASGKEEYQVNNQIWREYVNTKIVIQQEKVCSQSQQLPQGKPENVASR